MDAIYKMFYFIVLSLLLSTSESLKLNDIVIVILSQQNKFHNQQAISLKNDLLKQSEKLPEGNPVIYISNDLKYIGDWTVTPLIPLLLEHHSLAEKHWLFLVEERTHINLDKLLTLLSRYDKNEKQFIGHALYDRQATIIHHFAFFNDPSVFKYPYFSAGFAISRALFLDISKQISNAGPPLSDFSIDASHELALYIWKGGNGTALQHEDSLCIEKAPDCVTYVQPSSACREPVPRESIYFAVKTFHQMHKARIPVMKQTWGKFARVLTYFSDIKDNDIPTVSLGIPNTKHGHCGKTMAIIEYAQKKIKANQDIKWLAIVDDDTVLSVSNLAEILSCYDVTEDVALGERYGYDLNSGHGFNYLTGGGGMVFSAQLLDKILENDICKCPSIDAPDDMHVGACLKRIGATLTHSARFHQARPVDYPPEVLIMDRPVSFHKHWMVDPVDVYNEWFREDDEKAYHYNKLHTEL